MIKKNLTKKTIVITKQTWWNLCHWAAAAGSPEKSPRRFVPAQGNLPVLAVYEWPGLLRLPLWRRQSG